MGKCCKKKSSPAKSSAASPAPQKAESGGAGPSGQTASTLLSSATVGEAALAAGIIVLLPVLLDRIAPNALRSIKHGFELATKR